MSHILVIFAGLKFIPNPVKHEGFAFNKREIMLLGYALLFSIPWFSERCRNPYTILPEWNIFQENVLILDASSVLEVPQRREGWE